MRPEGLVLQDGAEAARRCLVKVITLDTFWGGEAASAAHLEKQWAALSTHWLLISEPPQKCPKDRCRLTCHGQEPAGAFSPPTMRLLRGAKPQTAVSNESSVA